MLFSVQIKPRREDLLSLLFFVLFIYSCIIFVFIALHSLPVFILTLQSACVHFSSHANSDAALRRSETLGPFDTDPKMCPLLSYLAFLAAFRLVSCLRGALVTV